MNNIYKRPVTRPNTSLLTEDQKKAFDEIQRFLSSDQHFFCLTGFAGTGKTTLVSFLIEDYLSRKQGRVCAAAMTNKATFVLKGKIDYRDDYLEIKTLHSLLGVLPHINNDGEQVFRPDPKNKSSLLDYSLVFVDEASMLDNILFSSTYSTIIGSGLPIKIIFVGDSFQLNPVRHSIAIPMIAEKRENYGIGHVGLTKIVRQAEKNPIIAFSALLRKKIYDPKPARGEDGTGIWIIPKEDQLRFFHNVFTNPLYDEDPSYCKVVAWKNKTVDAYNKLIRGMKYGRNIPELIKGETLIADEPISNFHDNSEILFYTNEELLILDFDIKDILVDGQMFKTYVASARSLTSGNENMINIIHDDSREHLEKKLEELSEKAKAEPYGSSEARSKWVQYYRFKEKFARCKYSFALTAHKVQGSTLRNVIVASKDILSNSNKTEAYRCLYTAVTRPTQRLFLI